MWRGSCPAASHRTAAAIPGIRLAPEIDLHPIQPDALRQLERGRLRGELHRPVTGSDFDLHARRGSPQIVDLRGEGGEGGGGEECAAFHRPEFPRSTRAETLWGG
jgi:hypothetical protein